MTRRNTVGTWCLVLASIPVLFSSAAFAAPHKSVAAEVAVGGFTIAERVAQQQQLHINLTAMMPTGVENKTVSVELNDQDRANLRADTRANGPAPLRVGVVKAINPAIRVIQGQPLTRGMIQDMGNGDMVWAITLRSPEARSIRVQFSNFSLPDGAEMYLLSTNGQAHGPYTGTGRNGTGEFWTRSVVSDSGVVQLHFNEADRNQISFTISKVAHIRGRPPKRVVQTHDSWPCSDNASCVIDVNCVNTGAAAPAENAVAKLEWIQGPFINTCTGGLLADTDTSTQIPYFLSADHCGIGTNSSLEAFFNYTTTSCNGGCPDSLVTGGTPPPASVIGVTQVVTGKAGDFTLLTLDQAPPAGATFLGWNNAPIAFTDGASLFRVSNANFGPQVFSQHDVDANAQTCTSWPRGERIYSADITGATMGGSSGSPVLNSASEVVGQLSGCCGFNCGDVCDAGSNSTVDGALAFYWDSVAQFLDPQGGGGTCDNDGSCGAGEDCNNCPDDCRSKVNGNPNSRFCCDGDLPDCGDSRCSESGFSCGSGGGGCTTDAECDDGQFCNGTETCDGGSCQSGSDPCPGQGCDEANDVCVSCGGNKASCSSNADCCSNNCRNGSCKGN